MGNESKQPESQRPVQTQSEHSDALLDEALGETFPASDPIAISFRKERASGGAAPGTVPATASNAEQGRVAAQKIPAQPTIFGGEAVLVERLLPVAHRRLVTIADGAPLIQAAKLLRTGTDIVVVCNFEGVMAGIITKTDVVGQISECQGGSCMTAASAVMIRDVVACHASDLLPTIWSTMKERGLKNVPITDQDGRPVGVLNARDALQVLLHEVEDEESLLRDYVMGVGYR